MKAFRQLQFAFLVASIPLASRHTVLTRTSVGSHRPRLVDACSVETAAVSSSHQTDAADATDGCTYSSGNRDGSVLFLIQPMPEYYKMQVVGGLQMGAHVEPITIGGICNGELLELSGIPDAKPLFVIEFHCPNAYFIADTQSSGLDRETLIVFANAAAHTKFAARFLHVSPERQAMRQRALAAQKRD